jgi:hypothetical protein
LALAPAARVAEGCTAAAILEIGIMGVTQRYNDKVKSHSKIPNPKRQTNAKAVTKTRNPKQIQILKSDVQKATCLGLGF